MTHLRSVIGPFVREHLFGDGVMVDEHLHQLVDAFSNRLEQRITDDYILLKDKMKDFKIEVDSEHYGSESLENWTSNLDWPMSESQA